MHCHRNPEVAIAGLAAMPMRFPGQYADEESAFSYNYFRDYDPRIGRYLQSDPLGLVAGLNTYAYAFDDPVNITDPDGRNPVAACAGNPACRGAVGGGLFAAGDLLFQLSQNNWDWDCIDWDRVAQQFVNGFALFSAGNPWGLLRTGGRKFGEMMRDETGGGTIGRQRTPAENRQARNQFKNNKDAARRAWEQRTGQEWPKDANGNPWPAEHTPPLKEGGDPMEVTPRDPGAPDPHNIPGPDGLTDYQRWGADGPRVRDGK